MMTLKQWRESQSLSQEQLAELMGVSGPYISMLESGKRKPAYAIIAAFERRSKGKVTFESFK